MQGKISLPGRVSSQIKTQAGQAEVGRERSSKPEVEANKGPVIQRIKKQLKDRENDPLAEVCDPLTEGVLLARSLLTNFSQLLLVYPFSELHVMLIY